MFPCHSTQLPFFTPEMRFRYPNIRALYLMLDNLRVIHCNFIYPTNDVLPGHQGATNPNHTIQIEDEGFNTSGAPKIIEKILSNKFSRSLKKYHWNKCYATNIYFHFHINLIYFTSKKISGKKMCSPHFRASRHCESVLMRTVNPNLDASTKDWRGPIQKQMHHAAVS